MYFFVKLMFTSHPTTQIGLKIVFYIQNVDPDSALFYLWNKPSSGYLKNSCYVAFQTVFSPESSPKVVLEVSNCRFL